MPLQAGRMNWTDSHWSWLIVKHSIDIVITTSDSPAIVLSHSAIARSSFSHFSTFATLTLSHISLPLPSYLSISMFECHD